MIETKKVKLEGNKDGDVGSKNKYFQTRQYIEDLTAFGWEKGEVIKKRFARIHHHYQILERDDEIDNYDELSKLEKKYEKLRAKLEEYNGIDIGLAIILFILFIFPFVIYVVAMNIKKKQITTDNNVIKEKMQKVVDEALELNR